MTYAQTEESKERNVREQTRQQLAEFLWRREGGHCVSYLVSTLAQAQSSHDVFGAVNMRLGDLVEQAFELITPVPDYEEAARQAGWDGPFRDKFDAPYFEDKTDGQTWAVADWQLLCDAMEIAPYDREVYEHWIVSNWLADKLTAKGEKCEKDFAGLTVWARTTTGQSIICDGVMQEIACDLWPTAEDRKRILA